MSKKKSKRKKYKTLTVGHPLTGKTAFMNRMVKEAEAKGIKVHVFSSKDLGIVKPTPATAPISPIELIQGPPECMPCQPVSSELMNRIKQYCSHYSVGNDKDWKPQSGTKISEKSNKTPKRKGRRKKR